MGGQKTRCMPSSITKRYLTPNHIKFIENFLNTGDKVLAYENVYPEPKKSRKVMSTSADRLLNNDEIRREIRARVEISGATKSYCIKRLMEIAEKNDVKFTRDGVIIDHSPNSQAVQALRLLAEMSGYVIDKATSQNNFNTQNIIIRMPYTEVGTKEMRKKIEGKIILES